MDLKKVLAANIKAYRLRLGLTQDQLAKSAKMNVRYLNQVENHGANLTMENLANLAASLEVKPHQLIQVGQDRQELSPSASELPGLEAAVGLLKSYISRTAKPAK